MAIKRKKAPKAPKSTNPIRVGNAVLVRTVTMYHTGRIVEVTPTELVLSDAAWVADVGRFYDALSSGVLNEVEPFPDGIAAVARGAIIDVTNWPHTLPRGQK